MKTEAAKDIRIVHSNPDGHTFAMLVTSKEARLVIKRTKDLEDEDVAWGWAPRHLNDHVSIRRRGAHWPDPHSDEEWAKWVEKRVLEAPQLIQYWNEVELKARHVIRDISDLLGLWSRGD